MNSSYLQKPQDVERKWYVVDAADKPLGRVAATVASILRGKHLPTFTPNVDCGDHVIVINADKIILTGNKLNQKVRYYHTGWVGGIKEIHYNKLMAEEPEKAVMYAVTVCFQTTQSEEKLLQDFVFTRVQNMIIKHKIQSLGQAK